MLDGADGHSRRWSWGLGHHASMRWVGDFRRNTNSSTGARQNKNRGHVMPFTIQVRESASNMKVNSNSLQADTAPSTRWSSVGCASPGLAHQVWSVGPYLLPRGAQRRGARWWTPRRHPWAENPPPGRIASVREPSLQTDAAATREWRAGRAGRRVRCLPRRVRSGPAPRTRGGRQTTTATRSSPPR